MKHAKILTIISLTLLCASAHATNNTDKQPQSKFIAPKQVQKPAQKRLSHFTRALSYFVAKQYTESTPKKIKKPRVDTPRDMDMAHFFMIISQ